MERRAASVSREYHERHRTIDLESRRHALRAFANRVYEERLGLQPTLGERATIEALSSPETLLLEIAHDGQLPHLGIVRMVLKTRDIARLDGRAATLYLIGNHYSPEMRPDNIHFGMPLRGRPPNQVKQPPKLRIGKSNVRTPFRLLPPPKVDELTALRALVLQYTEHNLAHERKSGVRIDEHAPETVERRLDDLFVLLRHASETVQNLGDWLIRVQHDLMQKMLGPDADAIMFLPMTELTELFRDELVRIARSLDVTEPAKDRSGTVQPAQVRESSPQEVHAYSFWIYCPGCFRRTRVALSGELTVKHVCATCGHRQTLSEPELWRWLMPDIVAYEAGLFRLGIGGWVIGSPAPYHEDIERAYRAVFREEMPPKFLLASVPTFRGVGDPPEGYGKTRLLRTWLEAEPSALATALRAPWNENPRIRSDILPRYP